MTRYGTPLLRRIRRTSVPVLLSLALVICGVVLLLAAWFVSAQVQQVNLATATLKQSSGGAAKEAAPSEDLTSTAPDDAQYIKDLGAIFILAKKFNLALGVVEYKAEPLQKSLLTVRSADFKTTDDYPKVKAFLSEVLAQYPHIALRELRIERNDGFATQGALLIRLSLVYSLDGDKRALRPSAIPTASAH